MEMNTLGYKPMSITEATRLTYEQTQREILESQRRAKAIEAAKTVNIESEVKDAMEFQENVMLRNAKRSKFLANAKTTLVTECLYKLLTESVVLPMTDRNKVLCRNLITNFVNENGAARVISDFANKNIILGEFSRISSKYYDVILKESECNEEFDIITPDVKDDFLAELQDVNTEVAADKIRKRVANSMSDFVETNALEKMEYSDAINAAKEKAAKNEAHTEEFMGIAKARINELRNRPKSVFECMMESVMKRALKDEQLKAIYVEGAEFNMNKILEDVQIMYTMLEMVNTCNIAAVNEEYIKEYVTQL